MSTNSVSLLSWTLREIARLEASGLRPPRLTEPKHERWHRLRRRLGWVAFIELLHEDLEDAFPTSFALGRWGTRPTAELDEATAKELVEAAARPDAAELPTFLRLVCRGLGAMDGGNIAALPKVLSHQRALELPGSGGRIAAHQVGAHSGLSFAENFTFVADTDAERVAIGIAAAELRSSGWTVFVNGKWLRKDSNMPDYVPGVYPASRQYSIDWDYTNWTASAGLRLEL